MTIRSHFLALTAVAGACAAAAAAAAALGASPAAAQDFRALQETRPVDPNANAIQSTVPPQYVAPRVLIAGDSWAQYMWDDGSHNDIFDKFGHEDRRALSLSLGSDPGPGYAGPEYAISGSEARQWADTANYPWIANMVAALEANPTIDLVLLSIGGNDILAGKSDGGWYKDMDLDTPGSEAALFDQIEANTLAISDAALAVRPDIRVMISSYDYPNFNVGFWCFVYACPKRRDLSRDPDNDLITDAELNDMMVRIEERRIGWVNADPRLLFDHGVGLMHYFYGDGIAAPRTLPYPGQTPPAYAPFPGGNPLRPSLRANFRKPNGIDADPIHLNFDGYQYKITSETETHFFPRFRGAATATIFSQGGANDGWTDGAVIGTSGVRVGDTGTALAAGIVSFDTASIPDGATITGAAIYLTRDALTGTNPFTSSAFGTPAVDVVRGTFGGAAVEASDATAPADAVAAGFIAGSAKSNGYAIRVEITGAGLAAINDSGLTQFRVRFPTPNAGTAADYVVLRDGDAPPPGPGGPPTLAEYMGSSAPFLDVTYTEPVGVPAAATPLAAAVMRPSSPNPFRKSTSLRFALAAESSARVDIFDVSGRHVATLFDGRMPAGNHSLVWDGRNESGRLVGEGVYLARLAAAGAASSVRLVRLAP